LSTERVDWSESPNLERINGVDIPIQSSRNDVYPFTKPFFRFPLLGFKPPDWGSTVSSSLIAYGRTWVLYSGSRDRREMRSCEGCRCFGEGTNGMSVEYSQHVGKVRWPARLMITWTGNVWEIVGASSGDLPSQGGRINLDISVAALVSTIDLCTSPLTPLCDDTELDLLDSPFWGMSI
jgi:hypothetical protein